jgi:hypothetical protein
VVDPNDLDICAGQATICLHQLSSKISGQMQANDFVSSKLAERRIQTDFILLKHEKI